MPSAFCTRKPVITGAASPANDPQALPMASMLPRWPLGTTSASIAGPIEYITSARPPLKVRQAMRSASDNPGSTRAAARMPLRIRHTETNTPRASRDGRPRRNRRCDHQAMIRLSGVVTSTNTTNIRPAFSEAMPRPFSR
ncbi:hypothetical protein D3C77_491150 [compost metagenome]